MIYEGGFKEGMIDGEGVIYKDGQMIFKGNYKENKKAGQGFFKTTIGTYDGNFRNDEFDGEGCFLWSNKKKAYIG